MSELVTNAVVHAGTDIDVTVQLHEGGARVEVQDRSAHLPVPRHYASLAATGRGLLMVDQLVTRWGVTSARGVRRPCGSRSVRRPTCPTATRRRRAGRCCPPASRVVLRRVPLLLHAAWQIHAESLLRELLLVRLDEETLSGLEEHAAASAAIALMEQQIRRPELAQDAGEVMAERRRAPGDGRGARARGAARLGAPLRGAQPAARGRRRHGRLGLAADAADPARDPRLPALGLPGGGAPGRGRGPDHLGPVRAARAAGVGPAAGVGRLGGDCSPPRR